MPSVFTLIGSSWAFLRKQPVLNPVIAWLFILPLTLQSSLLSEIEEDVTLLGDLLARNTGMSPGAVTATIILIQIIFSVWVLWGSACVLVVGKRIAQSKAGRSRTSFKAVRDQASKFIIPLFLTQILRACITLLWALLLIVPGVIYDLRTTFYDVIIVLEGKEYREALRESIDTVKGNSWPLFWILIALGFVLFIPAIGIHAMAQVVFTSIQYYLEPLAHLVGSTVMALSIVLYSLCSIHLYAYLKKA